MTPSSSRAETLQCESNNPKTSPEHRVTSPSSMLLRDPCPASQLQGRSCAGGFGVAFYRESFLRRVREREWVRSGVIFRHPQTDTDLGGKAQEDITGLA